MAGEAQKLYEQHQTGKKKPKISRPFSGDEARQVLVNQTMSQHNFDYGRRRHWIIWGARHRTCPTCHAAPYMPCWNMSDIKYLNAHPESKRELRKNRQPHDSRIDWQRILDGLRQRNYR